MTIDHGKSTYAGKTEVPSSHPYVRTYANRPSMTIGGAKRSPALLLNMIKDTIPLTTFLGLGAVLQYFITVSTSSIYPMAKYLLPLALVFGPWVRPLLIHFGLAKDPRRERILPGFWTAKLPGGQEDATGKLQSPEFVIFMIGAKHHAPFGRFTERSKRIGGQYMKMWADLTADPDSGLLNVDTFLGTSEVNVNKIRSVAIFKSREHLWKFARENPTHQQTWKEYHDAQVEGQIDPYEIWHEMFVVKEGGYESIYGNHDPKGSTMANIFRRLCEIDPDSAKVEHGDEWRSIMEPIGNHNRTSADRMGAEGVSLKV